MGDEPAPDSAGRMSDNLDIIDSPEHSHQGVAVNRHGGGDSNPNRSPGSPGPRCQQGGEEEEDEDEGRDHPLGSGASDGFRSDDADHGQFYPVSTHSFATSLGVETPCDDLPLVFSLPGQEDDSSKVYTCHLCNFRTAFKNSLVNHQAVHSDARPWVCEICDYAAKRKQDLKKHLQTMHGMVVDSLSLRLGNGSVQVCVSSSSMSSPGDVKPALVSGNAGAGDMSAVVAGYGGSHGMNPAAHLPPPPPPQQQQSSVAGFRPPLASSAMLSPTSRSAPVAGQGKEDHFPFCHVRGEEQTPSRFMPNSSTEFSLNRFKTEFRRELDRSQFPSSDNFLLQKLRGFKEEQHLYSCSENSNMKSCSQGDSRGGGRSLPSVSKLLPKREGHVGTVAEEYASVNTTVLGSPRHSDSLSSEGIPMSEDLSSYVTVSPPQSAPTDHHAPRQKRVSASSIDRTPIKAPRFQSPASSDLDCYPQVSSQSDRTVNSEFISSTEAAHSRSLDTKKSFHCAHCNILFFENAMYLMHAGLHDSANPWKCSICGQTFFEKYSFTSHFINQH